MIARQCEEAAALFITKQFSGIIKALDASLLVKINMVLIPAVNDQHMLKLARQLKELGAKIMNIMPLIHSGKMKNLQTLTCDELRKAKQDCEEIIP